MFRSPQFLLALALVIVGGLWVTGWRPNFGSRKSTATVPPQIERLANPKDIVGEWDRVEFPDAVIPVNWRRFSAEGEFQVCYGDMVFWGKFNFIDASTLETRDGNDGNVNRWKIGRADGKLVLIHQEYGWVEQYVGVPPGTLRDRDLDH